MARQAKPTTAKTVEALRDRPEEATRTNIPTTDYQPALEQETQTSVRGAYERRNRNIHFQRWSSWPATTSSCRRRRGSNR